MPPKGKNPKMARFKSVNAKWKKGKSSSYRRRITKAKKGELVHHKNKSKKDNKRSNFTILKPGKKITAIGKHNKKHPERNKNKSRK